MSMIGWFLAFAGLIGVALGLFQMFKGKKMNAVPFRAPSQIAQLGAAAADAKGLVSTEGAVGQQPLLTAPMSGRPCLAYELTVERKWEKTQRTENGTSTNKGSCKIFSDYKGGTFSLEDGHGAVLVDASQKPDASFEKTHESAVNVGMMGLIPSTLQFGGFQMNTPLIVDTEGRTTGFEGIEKIVPPSPTLYALGALAMGGNGPVVHTPKGIGTGKLVLSTKGRASLVKATKRNMVLGYAFGGALLVGGTLLGIFGPPPDASASTSCAGTLAADVVSCDGRMYESEGYDMKWTVTKAGHYTITAKRPKVKTAFFPALTVTAADGTQIAYKSAVDTDATVMVDVAPGTYTINVRDLLKAKVKGGYGFHLDIERAADAPPASSSSATLTAASVDEKPVAKGAASAVKAPSAAKVVATATSASPHKPDAGTPLAKPAASTTKR